MASVGIIEVPWDAVFWPVATAFGLVPVCVIAAGISLVSLFVNRDGLSVLGFILGLASVAVSAVAMLMILVISIANNPV